VRGDYQESKLLARSGDDGAATGRLGPERLWPAAPGGTYPEGARSRQATSGAQSRKVGAP
jgi:hypothetical protein